MLGFLISMGGVVIALCSGFFIGINRLVFNIMLAAGIMVAFIGFVVAILKLTKLV
jgi:hypothetical protein